MAKKKHDTDTLTRFDSAPDAPTVRQDFAGSEAETHRVEPQVFAPLRVCPECSLAWESSGEWCPSCGTAFEKAARESVTATRVMPRRAAEPPLARGARRRSQGQRPRGQASPAQRPPRREPPARASSSTGSALRGVVFSVLALCAIVAAFFVGQATRPSQADVDRSINQAVSTAKQSAASSYQKAFEKMQSQAAAAIAAARSKALAEGRADAQSQIDAQQQDSQSLFDNVTQCVLHGQC
jgi:hypothetical protein